MREIARREIERDEHNAAMRLASPDMIKAWEEKQLELKKKEQERRIHQVTFDDPWTLEYLAKAASMNGQWFEIVNQDGRVMRWTQPAGFTEIPPGGLIDDEWEP